MTKVSMDFDLEELMMLRTGFWHEDKQKISTLIGRLETEIKKLHELEMENYRYDFENHSVDAVREYHPDMKDGKVYSIEHVISTLLRTKASMTADEINKAQIAGASDEYMNMVKQNIEELLQEYIREYGEKALIEEAGDGKYRINCAVAKAEEEGLGLVFNDRNSKLISGVLPVQQLPHAEGLPLPEYQTEGSAGMDLTAAIEEDKILTIKSGEWELVPTGLAIALPKGYEGQIRPRSGLAVAHGITVLNSPGTIDSDYRGEVKVMLINHSSKNYNIQRGDRIAQLVIGLYSHCDVQIVDSIGETERGSGGFGSTGV